MNQSFPTLNDMASSLAVDMNAIEIIKQPLYDYAIYPFAGVIQLPFFQTGIGAGLSASPGNAGAVKALSDTNMIQGGSLPAPQAFWVDGIELDIQPGSSSVANTYASQVPGFFNVAAGATVQGGEIDVNRIATSGALTFQISQKNYYQEGPLYRFPSRHDLHLETMIATTSATVGEVGKAKLNIEGDTVKINPGVGIMTSQNFGVTLNWPVIVALPANNARIGCILNGWLLRGVQ